MKNDIFGIDPRTQPPGDIDATHLEPAQGHGLGGQHVADLRGSDAKRDGPEGPVRARVRVAAGDGRAGLGDPQLRTHDMNNALLAGRTVEEGDAEFPAALAQRFDHRVGERVGIRLGHLVRRHDVIDRGKRPVGHRHLEPKVAEHAKRLRAGHLMDQVRADQELRLAVRQGAHRVRFPDFLKKGFGHVEEEI